MISQYRKGTEIKMINFEEELKNFKPSLEVEEAEQAIYNHELTDMTDVMQEMLQDNLRTHCRFHFYLEFRLCFNFVWVLD